MYNGKNPTALTSQKMLIAALDKLLKEKDFKDLSVSELCSRSGVSRQTFYTLFGTKENILLYKLEQSPYAQHPQNQEMPEITLMDTCTAFSKFVVGNYELLKMLVCNDLTSLLNEQFSRAMLSCEQGLVNLNAEEKKYASHFISAGLCSLTYQLSLITKNVQGVLRSATLPATSYSNYRILSTLLSCCQKAMSFLLRKWRPPGPKAC